MAGAYLMRDESCVTFCDSGVSWEDGTFHLEIADLD